MRVNASECDEQHSSDLRRWRIDFKISELVVGELTRLRNDRYLSLTANVPPSYAENEMFLFPLIFFCL